MDTTKTLIINRYTCNRLLNIFIQAHEIDEQFNITKSFSKMQGDDISLFANYHTILINEVKRSSDLDKLNIIRK